MKILLFLICLFLCFGCTENNRPVSNPTPILKDTVLKTQEVSKNLYTISGNISTETSIIRDKLTDDLRIILDPNLFTLDENAGKVKENAIILDGLVIPSINTAITQTDLLTQDRDKWKEKFLEEQNRNNSAIKKVLIGIGSIAFLGSIGFVVLFALSPVKSKTNLIIAGILFGVSIAAFAIQTYFDEILIGGCIVLGLAIVYAVYQFWKSKTKIVRQEIATKDLVQLMETIKFELGRSDPKLREKLFGIGPSKDGIAYRTFNDSTDEVVKEIRDSGDIDLAKSMGETPFAKTEIIETEKVLPKSKQDD